LTANLSLWIFHVSFLWTSSALISSISLSFVFSYICKIGSEYTVLFATFVFHALAILAFLSMKFANFEQPGHCIISINLQIASLRIQILGCVNCIQRSQTETEIFRDYWDLSPRFVTSIASQ
jgi:hypothetical protein